MTETTPAAILLAHIEDTIRSIAELHGEHHRQATPVQRSVDRLTAAVGRPNFIGAITILLALWFSYNLAAARMGAPVVDPAPFPGLATVASVVALYVTVMILTTQRRENALGPLREQLTLELAIVSEQKTAKTIALLGGVPARQPQPAKQDRRRGGGDGDPGRPERRVRSHPRDPRRSRTLERGAGRLRRGGAMNPRP